jgi:hypothetical protein
MRRILAMARDGLHHPRRIHVGAVHDAQSARSRFQECRSAPTHGRRA